MTLKDESLHQWFRKVVVHKGGYFVFALVINSSSDGFFQQDDAFIERRESQKSF